MDKIIAYFKNNIVLGVILLAIVAILVILIICAIIRACANSKKKKQTQSKTTPPTLNESELPAKAVTEKVNEPVGKPLADETPIEEIKTISDTANNLNKQVNEEKAECETASETLKDETSSSEVKSTEKASKTESTKNSTAKKTIKKSTSNKTTSTEKTTQKDENKNVTESDAETQEKTSETHVKNAYAGKWIISVSSTNDEGVSTYCFELKASNGEKLLSSVDYKSINGAKNGIKTYKTNIEKDNFTIAQNKKGYFYFKLLNGSGHLLSTGETYPNKTNCENAVESVKRFAASANIVVEENE